MKRWKIPVLCALLTALLCVTAWATDTAELMAVYNGECGATEDDHVTWELDTASGTLTISGAGDMTNYDYNDRWNRYRYMIKTLTIQDGVTYIGTDIFADLPVLESVTIGNDVTVIAEGAFAGCGNLKAITFGDSIETIGKSTFYNCYSITDVTFPDSLSMIDESAFQGCYYLSEINFGSGVSTIADYAFSSCYAVKNITVPDNITYIGSNAFRECRSLESVIYGSGVSILQSRMFAYCDNIKSIVIPDSVRVIDGDFLDDCNSKIDLYYGGTKTQWGFIGGDRVTEYQPNLTVHYNSTGPDNPGTTDPFALTLFNPSFGASIPLDISGAGTQTVNFATAFYNQDGRFIGMEFLQTNIYSGLQSVFVPINRWGFVPSLKAFALDDGFRPLSPAAGQDSENAASLPDKYAAILSESDTDARNALVERLTESEAKDFVKQFSGWLH